MWRGIPALCAVALALGGCQRPTVHDDKFRPIVNPVVADPAPEAAAPQGRVALEKPTIGPPQVRGPTQIDGFVQDDATVDILWVIDNSGSMANKRDRLAKSFDQFIRTLTTEQVSFHIGVTTTDMTKTGAGFSGQLIASPTVITNTTPNPVAAFTDHVTMPPSRVEDEQGLAAGLAAVTEPLASGANAGFLRPNANLAIIVVSDEDDHSLGDPAYFARRFRALKGVGNEDTVTYSAVAGDLPDGCVAPGDQNLLWGKAKAGKRYKKVTDLTHGIFASICAADFNDTLTTLGLAFAGLRRIFPLSATPVVSSLQVFVNNVAVGQSRTNGWIYDATSLSIQFLGNFVPPPGATIEIHYDLKV